MYITTVPHVKAMTTESRMAETMPMAREVLMYCPSEETPCAGSPAIL